MPRITPPPTNPQSVPNSAARDVSTALPVSAAGCHQRAEALATECFGSSDLGGKIIEIVNAAASIAEGTNAQGRPAPRRDKIASAASAAKKLLKHLKDLGAANLIDILTPPRSADRTVTFSDAERALMPDLPAIPVHAGEASAAYRLLTQTTDGVALLADRLDAALQATQPARAGAPRTPGAAHFLTGVLADLWQLTRGDAPSDSSLKRGGFGYLVEEAAALRPDAFERAVVRTALRRFIEARDQARS